MADLILVFQKNNVTSCKRFGSYLSRNGWGKITAGVFHKHGGLNSELAPLWQKAVDEFSFDPESDFLAIFPSGEFFIPTRRYYMKQAPPWPYDDPYLLEVSMPPLDPDSQTAPTLE